MYRLSVTRMCVIPCEKGEHKAIISSNISLQYRVHNIFFRRNLDSDSKKKKADF